MFLWSSDGTAGHWPTWKVVVPAVFSEFDKARPRWAESNADYTVFLYQRRHPAQKSPSGHWGSRGAVQSPSMHQSKVTTQLVVVWKFGAWNLSKIMIV